MNTLLFGTLPSARASIGLLAVRLAVGSGLVLHGWGKIHHAMEWMGPSSPVPGFFQCCSAWAEFGGGICFLVGLLTPMAAVAVAINMCVALAMVHVSRGDPFVSATGAPSAEPAVLYLAAAVLLMTAGAGRYSADALWTPRTGQYY